MSGPPTKEANQPATAVTDQRSGSAHLALVVLGLPLLLNLGVSAALILELRDFGVEQGHALDAVSRRKEAELALEVAAARRETIASEERNLSARVDQLRSQTTDLDARDAARSRAIEEESRATAKAAGLMQQAEQSQATYDALQSAIAASQERLATANAQRVSSQSTLQDLLPKKAALDAEVVELRKQIVDLDARNADRRHAVEEESRAAARTIELQKQVDLANAAIESLKAAVSTEQEKLTSVRTQTTNAQSSIQDLLARKSALEAEVAVLAEKQAVLAKIESDTKKTRSDLSLAEEQVVDVGKRRDAAQVELQNARSKLVEMKTTIATTSTLVEEATARIGELKPQRDALEEQVARLHGAKALLEAANARQTEVDAQVELSSRREASLRGSTETLTAKRDQLAKAIAAAEETMAGLRAQGDRYTALAGRIGSLQQQEIELGSRVSAAEGRIKALQDQEGALRRKQAEAEENKKPSDKKDPRD